MQKASHNIKFHNRFFEKAEEFKYLGTTLNQNPILEEIKSRLMEWLLSFGAESFVFPFAIQKFKDYIEKYYFVSCFV